MVLNRLSMGKNNADSYDSPRTRLVHILDEPSGITAHNGVWSNIFRDNSTGGNNGILADGYSRQDGCACTYPRIAADMYGVAD